MTLLQYTRDYRKRLSIIRKVLIQEKGISFKAFNDGIRLNDCIHMQHKLIKSIRCVVADSIYANNANKKFCTKYEISTSFVRKGRAARDESLRKLSEVNFQWRGPPGLKAA